ncbi:hypothetical protein PC39_04577 [Salinisphaera sp. PC39]|uniref:DUF2970 domain-containing protein n=1 Tax=Salinisphaera sp. PC39 TaxID=1304156 RepID=UPI0033421389
MTDDERREPDEPLTLWQTIMSVLAAFFGVQSSTNRQRDFSRGRPLHFILIGLVATVIFVLVLVLVVRLVLAQAGA